MGKTQFDRFNDNVWKRQLASEQKKVEQIQKKEEER